MPSSSKDYYKILGIDRDADVTAIKSAYKKLAVKYHPDKNPGDTTAEEHFKEAAEAYATLSDSTKRRDYDIGGSDDHINPTGWSFNFGQQRKPERKNFRGPRGLNLQVSIELTLKEIYDGTIKTVAYNHHDRCDTCGGFGGESHDVITCDACNGFGRTITTLRHGISMVQRFQDCATCSGSGSKLKTPCKTCTGTGRITKRRSIKVPVPKGMSTDTQLIMRSGGHAGPNLGPFGDLMVKFSQKPDDNFTRQGNDLHMDITVPISRALLGGKIDVRTMLSRQQVDINPGARHGDTYHLKDFGMPIPDTDDLGDLVVHLSIEIPSKLSDEQRSTIIKLRDLGL